MQQLKYLVIFMGVLIVLGLAFLVYGIATGLHKKKPSTTASTAVSRSSVQNTPTGQTFGDHTITLPDNQTVLGYTISENRLVVYVQNSDDGNHQWLVFDLMNGQHLGSIQLAKPTQ